jgi:5-methylcytosine-specific restriction endonuclease McrA
MPLLNPFIDSIVCVGFNSEHGLVIDPKSDKNNSPFLSLLQPYVLAIITADQAIYPQSKGNNIIDQFYPSVCYSKSSSVLTSNTTSQKKHIIPNAFNSLPLFCSPDGVKISHQLEDSRIHHIVFTQEDGKRSYAVVLTFQEQFILKTDKPYDDGRYQIESFTIQSQTKKPKNKIPSSYRHENTTSNKKTTSRMRERSHSISSNRTSTILHNTFEPFYLPHCLILISSYPYWTAMQETISIIHDEIIQSKIEPSSTAYKQLIENYAFLTCNTPIPPIAWERFSLSFNVTTNQSVLTFDPPINTNRTVLDLDLSILLLTFNIGKLLDVLAAILTEQSILFFSSDYFKLVTTLECLLYLIYPFKWIHIYIPIVPDSLSDYYLEGPPGSYIMGVHSRHQSTVEILDLSLTCNLDNDENIHIPSDIKFYRIPSTKLHRFIRPITEFLDYIKTERALQNVHTPIRLYIDEQREFERQHRVESNNKIIEIFLDLMVDLCGDTLKPIYWKIDHQQQSPTNSLTRLSSMERNKFISNQTVFSKEKYLLSKTPGVEQEFYRIFIESTAFQFFIKEEMGSTIPTEFQKTCQLRSQLNRDQPYRLNTKLTDNQVSE